MIFVLYSVKPLMLEKTAPVQYSRGKIVILKYVFNVSFVRCLFNEANADQTFRG